MEAAPPVSLAKETAARRETMLESEAATRLLVERALHQVEAELHRLETGRDKVRLAAAVSHAPGSRTQHPIRMQFRHCLKIDYNGKFVDTLDSLKRKLTDTS